MHAAGVQTLHGCRNIMEATDEVLARGLGASRLPEFTHVTSQEMDLQEQAAYEDAPGGVTKLRWVLAQALLELGWVEHIGQPDFRPPPAGEQNTQLLLEA